MACSMNARLYALSPPKKSKIFIRFEKFHIFAELTLKTKIECLKYKSYENKNNFPICFLSVFINIVFLQ